MLGSNKIKNRLCSATWCFLFYPFSNSVILFITNFKSGQNCPSYEENHFSELFSPTFFRLVGEEGGQYIITIVSISITSLVESRGSPISLIRGKSSINYFHSRIQFFKHTLDTCAVDARIVTALANTVSGRAHFVHVCTLATRISAA